MTAAAESGTVDRRPAVLGGDPVRTRPFPAWPRTTDRAEQAVLAVLRSGHWWQSGSGQAERLEEWLASYHAVGDCVAVANGTVALELVYRALGIGPGDEVLVPALTFFSTASAVRLAGAVPIPVDVLPTTLCVDVEDAARKLTPRTKAIVPVHLAGQPADLDAVGVFAAEAGLRIVEDAAQAVGARWGDRPVGSFGDAATLSFQAAKLLSGGEGGAVLVRQDPELASRIRILANCGRERGSSSYAHSGLATNARISEFHSALLLAQTDDLAELGARRAEAAGLLARRLTERGLASPMEVDRRVSQMPWYMFVFRPSRRVLSCITTTEYASMLTAEGVPATRMYPAFHLVPAFADSTSVHISCPVAEEAAEANVWLHHRLLLAGESGVSDIVAAIQKIDDHCRSQRT